MRRLIPLILLLIGTVSGQAQPCDTVTLQQDVRAVDDLVWKNYPQAFGSARELVERYNQGGAWCKGQTMMVLGKVIWSNGDYDESVNMLRSAVALSRQAGDTRNMADADMLIADNFYYQGYYDSAEKHFKSAIVSYESAGLQTELMGALNELAVMYHRKGDMANALRYLYRSEELLGVQPPGTINHMVDFTGTSLMFNDTLYYRTKIRDELRQLRSYLANGNQVGRYHSLFNLGRAHQELGDHLRAARYMSSAAKLQSALGFYPFWYDVGREYGLAGVRDSCFYFHYLAKSEFSRAAVIKVLTTYEELGDSHAVFGQLDSAVWYYELALAMNVKMNNRITVPNIQCKLGRVYHKKGLTEKAEGLLRQGLIQAKDVSAKHLLSLCQFGSEFYEATGKPERALYFARRVQSLTDSINRNEAALALIHFQAQYESARKGQELDEAKLVVRNRTIILTSLAGFSILVVAWGVTLYLQRRKIKRQNLMLQVSNAEQRALTQEIHHRVKNNLQYIVSLLNLQAQSADNEGLATQIEEIKSRILTMAAVHQRLYQTQGVHRVEVAPFITELVANILNVMPSQRPIIRTLRIDPLQVDVDQAISIGLLINELMTNAVKHAFANHPSPEASLAIFQDGPEWLIWVRDNGPGFQFPGSGSGFGMKLIQLLVRKLNGRLNQPDMNTLEIRMKL